MKTWIGLLAVLVVGGGLAALAFGSGDVFAAGDAAAAKLVPQAGAPQPTEQVAVLSSLAKLRPDDEPVGADRIGLRALRGECEAAQIAVRAGEAPTTVRARIDGSLGDGVDVLLHRVELVELKKASGPEGAAGRWPDPLVPAVDPYVGEERSAFPFAIPSGESRAILVEVCVGGEATPGEREAQVDLSIGASERHVPLALRIEREALPTTSSLDTSFGFSSRRAALGHYGRAGTEEEVLALDRLYRTALLRHRISAHGGTFDPPPFRKEGKKLVLDFSQYDRELAPFLDGSALPSGARATTVDLRTHPKLASDADRIAYWRAIVKHHEEKGWEALLFDYAHDEPKREELPPILERAKLVKKADDSIRVLLTASLDPALVGPVDLWTPNLNCLYVKKSEDEWCSWRAPQAAYRQAVERGAKLWWYQSCSSHGCGEGFELQNDDAAYFRGWPSYVVDAAGSRARAMGWLAHAEGIGGELYWDTVIAYAPEGKAQDPWSPGALWAFGGNGDGTFFYPGTPGRIGGKTHVPVGSLRLIHVRDGLEDYELLRLVAARPGGAALAMRAAKAIAAAPYRVTDDPGAVESARNELLDFLAGKRPAGGTR